MVEDITSEEEEEEKVHFPKVDRSRLYSILLIIFIIVSIYVSIIIKQIWISFFIIIPILSLSKREEISQVKVDLKQLVLNSFSKLVKFIVILAIIGLYIFLLIKTGIFITVILIFISFLLYRYISASITRKNFKKSKKLKSEVL